MNIKLQVGWRDRRLPHDWTKLKYADFKSKTRRGRQTLTLQPSRNPCEVIDERLVTSSCAHGIAL
jgi:hypothetical protein